MVPAAFTTFFATSASAGAALVGLLFVAVSIAPHETVKATAPIEQQATSSSAFTALVNGFFISLGALIPNSNVGDFALILGAMGLLNTLALTVQLLRDWKGWNALVWRGPLVVAGLGLYTYQMILAALLIVHAGDSQSLNSLVGLLIGVYGLGIVRAWQLLGAQRFGVVSGLLRLLPRSKEPHAPADEEKPPS